MPTITTRDGTKIFYKDWGKGQPIVFHHGWPLSADDWDGQMMFFLQRGYRVIEIPMPALRDRREDIPYLVAHFLRKCGGGAEQAGLGISEGALRLLQGYPWPGNVRELENVIARAVVLCRGQVIGADLVDLRMPGAPSVAAVAGARLDEALDGLEREMILRALDETRQVKARAARVLGISERSLWYTLRKHGLS